MARSVYESVLPNGAFGNNQNSNSGSTGAKTGDKASGGNSGTNSGPDMQDYIQQNLLKVDVYLKSMETRTVVESPTYEFNSMLYALGGAISLFLGISLSMIFEVLELLIDIFLNMAMAFSSAPVRKKSKQYIQK